MKVYVHGNCQSYVIARMLEQIYPAWDIKYFEIHAQPIIDENHEYRRIVSESDIILAQPIHDGYRGRTDLSLSWVRQEMRRGAALAVFPSMHFAGHHIGVAELGLPADLSYDAVVALMVASGASPDGICKTLMSPEYLSSGFIESEIALSIGEIRRREIADGMDVPISPFLEEHARLAAMFHIVNHPFRATYAYMINGILQFLGFSERVGSSGADWQPVPHMPLLPAVRRYLDRADRRGPKEPDDYGDLVHIAHHPPMTLPDFYRAMALQLQGVDRQRMIAAVLRENWARELATRLFSAGIAQTLNWSTDVLAAMGVSAALQPCFGLGVQEQDSMSGGSLATADVPDLAAEVPREAVDLGEQHAAAEAAHARGDLQEALRIWESIRAQFHDDPEAFRRPAAALRSAGQFDDAELIVREGRALLPQDLGLAVEYGWIAYQRGDAATALDRWRAAMEEFPEHPAGSVYAALVLRDMGRYDEADELLAVAEAKFPDDPWPAADRATLSNVRGAWLEASGRWDRFRARFPDHAAGYIGAAWAFRSRGMYDLADILLSEGEKRFPDLSDILRDRANVAHDRGDWEEAARRWARVRSAFPDDQSGFFQGAKALLALRRHEEAEAVLADGCARFPADARFYIEIAEAAGSRGDRREALRRWIAARRRFPLDRLIQERLFEARMRLVEADPDAMDRAETDLVAPGDQHMHDVMTSFESIGGALFGCEFGAVQRAFGAEPLSLLRWADLAPEHITAALEERFAGVGQLDNTEIFTYGTSAGDEYGTRDKRFHMVMHTFVMANNDAAEKVLQSACRRLQYLRRKLIDDLESAAKIFVYKLTYANLTPEQLRRIHSAIRSYGSATLLYVRYSEPGHPDGSVEAVEPGLLVGYLDRFGASRDGKALPIPIDSWASVCKSAYELWKAGASEGAGAELAPPQIAAAVSPPSVSRLPMIRWSDGLIAHLRREAENSEADNMQRRLRTALADVATGVTTGLHERLSRIAHDYPGYSRDDSWFFENFLLTAIASGAFHLVEQIVREHFSAVWRCQVTIAPSTMPVPVARWEVISRECSRFVFHPDVFQADEAISTILFWIRILPLCDSFHRSDNLVRGAVDLSLWDVGLVPGISFSDNNPRHFLAPDPMFLSLQGYRQLRADHDRQGIPWDERIPSALWRGSTTGAWDNNDWETLPRIRLCRIAAAGDGRIDAGINSVVQMTAEVEAEIRASGLMRATVASETFAQHKYQIDIDGNTNSWPGLFHKLYSGSPVLKVQSRQGYRQWYYDRLVPWYNYVPVSADMADLCAKIDWLRANDARAREIGERGRELAAGLDYEGELVKAGPVIVAAMRQHAFLETMQSAKTFAPAARGGA